MLTLLDQAPTSVRLRWLRKSKIAPTIITPVLQLADADHPEANQPSAGRFLPASTRPLTTLPSASRTPLPIPSKVGPEVREPRGEERRQEAGHGTDEDDHGVAVPDRLDRAS
jgi:hypothetical protein